MLGLCDRMAHLVLIGGVKRDFSHLGVLFPHGADGATAQLNALQQGSLRSVTGHISLAGEEKWCQWL